MSKIEFENIEFSYDDNNKLFDNLNFNFDSNWKLGLISINGYGKTTLLKLMVGEYPYNGKIKSNVDFIYFPYDINEEYTSYELFDSIYDSSLEWKFQYEASLLGIGSDLLERKINTLSMGERTKVLLSMMFIEDNKFLLIDEPTNYLDIDGIKCLANYLKRKNGFILISHDRYFLDLVVDHIAYINKSRGIEIYKGNFTSWYNNKINKDNYELNTNNKLKKEIERLSTSSQNKHNWAIKAEKGKYERHEAGMFDKGYIGHKSAKMMKSYKVMQKRINNNIEKRKELLRDVYEMEELKLNCNYNSGILINIENLSISYNKNIVVDNMSFKISVGDRVWLRGSNGCGKSSIIKCIMGDDNNYTGSIYKKSNITISYINQDTSNITGSINDFIINNKLDRKIFMSILSKLSFNMNNIDKTIENYSDGEKKKLVLASSLSTRADIYIWDEPLNYIDIFTRIQIEKVILKYRPTIVFSSHDEEFGKNISTSIIDL